MRGNEATSMIKEILNGSLSEARYKNSKMANGDPEEERKSGAVFVVRTKDDLRQARGTVMTSQEAVIDSIGATHWTPNVYRFGTYKSKGPYFKIIQGHEEQNLRCITTFVVDVDYPNDEKPEYTDFDIDCFNINLTSRKILMPTMILETPHGYQAYYMLKDPVWIRRTPDGRFPALVAAKRVSASIRKAVAAKNPNTDTGANDFGFFRMPGTNNVVELFEDSRPTFDQLMDWSIRVSKKFTGKTSKTVQPNDQVHTTWFQALAGAQVPNAQKSGYGRNNCLLTLCLAVYSSGKAEEEAYDFADEWNSRQMDPLTDREVRSIVRSAFSGKYKGATMAYVRELCERYTPGITVDSVGHAWNHMAKDREDRDYSHQEEWLQDLLHLVRTGTDRVRGHVRFTYRELEEALGISKQSLRRLLDRLEKMAAISVHRIKGCKGGIYLATAQMMVEYVKSTKITFNFPATQVTTVHVKRPVGALRQESLFEPPSLPYQRL